MPKTDPVEMNIAGVQSLVGSKLNKVNTGASTGGEGVEGELEDALTLKLSDAELLLLASQWEAKYRGYEAKVKLRQQANKTYYLGRQREGSAQATTEGAPVSANLLFESAETFYPSAMAKNPEPVVWSDNETEGVKLAKDVKTMLQYHADTLVLRRKLTLMCRHWSVYFIGVIKHGWDDVIGDIKSEVRDPRNLILNPDGFVDCYADYEGYLGERITVSANQLIDLFPKHKAFITIVCDGKLGTDVTYTEWWTDEYCFYTFKGKVLEKNKNPNFNYPEQVPVIGSDGSMEVDQDNQPAMQEQKGRNHFARPKKPYTFLSVFSFGEQPHDETGLIEQNIPNQKRVSRRTDQIDYNLSRQNNSIVLSQNNFNQETGKQFASAMAAGRPALVPAGGPIGEAVHVIPAPGINQAFFTELENSKQDLRSIFGTEGISSQPPNENTTARGMILNQQFDNTRIGGGIGDALEQVADNIFNWWVQLYHVYYDEPHFATIVGQTKAVEYVTLSAQDMNRKLVISVTPDSMKPHDELTEMNQAMSLYEAGVLDPKTLLTMLNVPDPQKTAESTVLWLLDKQAYLQLNFPEIAAQLQQMQQQQAAQQQAQMAQQGQAQQQQAEQQMSQKDQMHQQKLSHNEQAFQQKQNQKELSVNPASASLSAVPLPK